MRQKLVPGTILPYTGNDGMFSMFRPMIEVANGLSLSQVCAMTGLEVSTVQNWVKRGFVAHPKQKKYFSRHFARILLISSLRDCMQIDRIGEIMKIINGDPDDESDDIISEEQLYDYLCEIIGRMDDNVFSREAAKKNVEDVITDYIGPDNEAKNRLEEALLVMVYAYVSGRLKQEADTHFGKLKENFIK